MHRDPVAQIFSPDLSLCVRLAGFDLNVFEGLVSNNPGVMSRCNREGVAGSEFEFGSIIRLVVHLSGKDPPVMGQLTAFGISYRLSMG